MAVQAASIWNVSILPQHYMASQHRRPWLEFFSCSWFI